MRSIIILTQYFPPEMGAPQNRLHSLALRLQEFGWDVSIATAMPNYPELKIKDGYRFKLFLDENHYSLKIYRSWIFANGKKSIFWRLLNYFSFVLSSFLRLLSLKKHDIVFFESPPLFLGLSAWGVSLLKGSKLVMNVSDLWPESAEKLNLVTNQAILKITYKLEAFLYRRCLLITGQTKGIVNSIKDRFPGKQVEWLPNGIDANTIQKLKVKATLKGEFKLMYCGLFGYAQGLEVILNAANILKEEPNVKFYLIGEGPEKKKLVKLKEELDLQNLFILPSVTKERVLEFINESDAYIVPLKRLDLFTGAIPSKVFEPLALRKPILLGVDGEAKALFIEEANSGLFFEPENHLDLASKILELKNNPDERFKLGENGRRYVFENFDRIKIAKIFSEKLVSLL